MAKNQVHVTFDADELKGAGRLNAQEVMDAVRERIVTRFVDEWFDEHAAAVAQWRRQFKDTLWLEVQKNLGASGAPIREVSGDEYTHTPPKAPAKKAKGR